MGIFIYSIESNVILIIKGIKRRIPLQKMNISITPGICSILSA